MAAPLTTPAPRPFDQFWIGRALRSAGSAAVAGMSGRLIADQTEAWAAAGEMLGGLDEVSLVQRLAAEQRVAVAALESPDPRLATLLPEQFARRYNVVPLRADNRTIWIATCDPFDFDAEQSIGFASSRSVVMELAGPTALRAAFESVYQPLNAVNRMLERLPETNVESVDSEEDSQAAQAAALDRDPALEAPVAKLIDALISEAVKDGTSDIHIEPVSNGISVRYRVDGILKEVMRLPETTGPSLVRRIKILCKLDVTNSMRPQDGRMSVKVDGLKIDLRIATVPIARRGEKVVIRILDKRHLKVDLHSLGLALSEQDLLDRLLGHREGLILVTGPTGSGKTTTLYAALNQLKTGKVNITTVEDPVEYDIPDIAQIQVNNDQGLTFAATLRSVLRQDPDVLLVGEIRDKETAEIAVQASMTGHLVLSTLHTNDAPSAATRMRDMGIDGFKLGGTLIGVVAQRLMRSLCKECSVPITVDELPPEARPPAGTPFNGRKAVGCKVCRGMGYKGRMPIIEVMVMDPTIGRLVERGDSPLAIGSAARAGGMRTLWESGLLRVWDGRASFDELQRVLGEGERSDDADEPVVVAPVPAAPVVTAASASGIEGLTLGASFAQDTISEPAVVKAAKPKAVKAAKPRKTAAKSKAKAPVVAEPPAPGATRVLVVDDDPQMRRFVRTVLERDAYIVIEAADGLEALELVEREQPHLVLMDLDMPRLDGLATLEELRDRIATATLPVILLTARIEDEGEALDKGASDFMAKPLQPKALSARVRAVLRRHHE